jgi:hypothetical protein
VTAPAAPGPVLRDGGPPPFDANCRAPHGASLDGATEHEPRDGAARSSPLGLVERGPTVSTPNLSGFGLPPEEWEARDALLGPWRCSRVETHRVKAARALALNDRSRAAWHDARAGTLTEGFRSRCLDCGQRRHVRAWCDTCGEVHVIPVGCGLSSWCEVCAHRRAAGIRKRILPAIAEAERRALRAWRLDGEPFGQKPAVRLLTLTVRTTGDATRDRETIRAAWVRFRAWLQLRHGARPFVLCWEVTDGATGPHVHAHVVTVWPFLDVRGAAAAWVRATEGAAEGQGFDMRTSTAEGAAKYAAKYAAKGCHPSAVSRETWAAWTMATAGKRSYTTSRGLLALVDTRSRPPCCTTEGGWGGAQLHRGPPTDPSAVLPTGPPATVSRETVADP